MVAYVIDALVGGCLSGFVTQLLVLTGTVRPESGWFVLVALCWVYLVVPTARTGQTAGKRIMKIRVVDESGKAPGFGRALLRETVGKFVSGLVFGLGYLWALGSQGRCWHDTIAGTRVLTSSHG